MAQGTLLVVQRQVRIQQAQVDARTPGFLDGLFRWIHDSTIGQIFGPAKQNLTSHRR